jgi:hypothetical protein
MSTVTTAPIFQVSHWGLRADEMGRTQFFERGQYADWCHWECARWAERMDDPKEAWIESNKTQVVLPNGYAAEKGEAIAVFSWAKYQKPIDAEDSQ